MNNWRLFQLGVNSEEKVGNLIFYACLPQNPRWSNIENLRFCSCADMLSAAHPECNKIEKPSEKEKIETISKIFHMYHFLQGGVLSGVFHPQMRI